MFKALSLLLFSLLLAAVPSDRAVGPTGDGAYLVPTGQLVRPGGQSVEFAGRPVDLIVSPDGRSVYVKHNTGLVVIDTQRWILRQELTFPVGGGSMHGIAVTRDGRRVYATTAQDLLWEATVGTDGTLAWGRKISLPGPGGKGDSHACGIAMAPDQESAYVCLSRNNSLGVVDLRSGRLRQQLPVGIAPFDVAVSPDGRTAWVSDWGGRHPRRGERSAPSSGTPTLVDERGIAASGVVSLVALGEGREIAQVETGLHPSDLELSADGRTLYVANANSDTVSVIDTGTRRITLSVSVRPKPNLPYGSGTNALALGQDGERLYVANGGNNAVAVLPLPPTGGSGTVIERFLPTGWYPGAIVTDARFAYVANVKGVGLQRRTANRRGWNVHGYLGSVTRLPLSMGDLTPGSRELAGPPADAGHVMRVRMPPRTGMPPVPVPARVGEPSVFQHVVYVIKENRTYDQLLGDLPRGNHDASLCIYGREVTPNHHALAEEFALLDNFYCNGVLSADGHSWVTEGNVTDHLEKSFGGFTRSYTFGDDPLTYSSSGFLWDNALAHGRTFRNYGEMDYAEPLRKGVKPEVLYKDLLTKRAGRRFSQNIGIAKLRRYSCREYPGWNLIIPDVLRADVFLKELRAADAKGAWPHLQIVYLPNDHTSGTTPGLPTPRAQVADNDLALGRVVEGISRSRFWPQTCLFVVEDDPQDGFDHVDGHRSICLVVSPYTRRGAVVSRFYNQTAVLHTMERMLGLPPMNQMDALAPTMEACFTLTADPRPYSCRPNRIPLDEINPPLAKLTGRRRYWAEQSMRLPLARVDEADEATFNQILWHAARGEAAPYPRLPARLPRAGIGTAASGEEGGE